jgi:Flp pilus assembly pilin Flp
MKNRGQNLIEFSIIVALIAVAGIVALIALGGNINSMISGSTQKVETYKPFGWDTQASSSVLNQGSTAPVEEVIQVGSYDVSKHSDGIYSFEVDGQKISLPQEYLDQHNAVLQTTGSSALEDLVSEIAYMIQTHKDEYPDQDVPIEINFGDSTRTKGNATVSGESTVNTTAIKVGDHIINLVYDHTCEGGNCQSVPQGKFRIEGTVQPDNTLVASVGYNSSSTATDYTNTSNTFDATYDPATGAFSGTYGADVGNYNWVLQY